MEEDGDSPQLSAHALAALQEFYKEQAEREANFTEGQESNKDIEFEENWQLSQFWYDSDTAEKLARAALNTVGPDGRICLISCPTLYKPLCKLKTDTITVHLLEFDKRFGTLGLDFIFYDYQSPLDIPRNLAGSYDLVIADPPFLSNECLTKVAVTIKFLAKDKILLCTGAVMEDLAKRLLDLNKCQFEPHHKNNLANEFCCYANYNMDELIN